MIAGNQTWVNALGQQQKRPLYVLLIPWFGLYLASFSLAGPGVETVIVPPPAASGWGVILWGIGGWGT
jgi:hypothetical protein